MAGSVNKVILIGRLGKDPELEHTSSGAAKARLTLATDEVFKDRSGEQQRRTEEHSIIVWSKLAEICGEYLAKGRQVCLEGSIRSRQWEDESGNRRTAYEIVARQMTMLGSRADSERASAASAERDQAYRPSSAEPGPEPTPLSVAYMSAPRLLMEARRLQRLDRARDARESIERLRVEAAAGLRGIRDRACREP